MSETLAAEARKIVDQYLDAIEQALSKSGTPRAERQSITRDVEAHVLDLFAARYAGNPTPAETQAVLGELDSPEDYLRGANSDEIKSSATPAMMVSIQESRLSRAAVIGAV